MSKNNYREQFNQLPIQWSTAKEIGLAAATLNAMERQGLVQVDRNKSPMRYKPLIEEGSREKIEHLLQQYDNSYRIVLVYGIACIECLKRNENNQWQAFFAAKEIDDVVCSHVWYINIYKNGYGIGTIELKK